MTAAGRPASSAWRVASASVMSSSARGGGADVVAEPRGAVDDRAAEHAAGAGDEQLHRIPISELSPTMKR